MRARHYIAFAVVVVLGLAGSLMVMANGSELALIRFRDREFDEALQQYEAQLRQGDLSAGVVMPLCQLYLQYGRVDAAVALMERFVATHPRDIQAHLELAKYYQYAQRSEDYVVLLEKVVRLSPSEDTLRRLSDIYNFRGQVDAQITVLQQLIRMYPGESEDVLALAHLQAAQGALAAAASTLATLHDTYPAAATPVTMQFFVSVLLDAGEPAQAAARAAAWLSRHPDPEVAVRFASLLSFKGRPADALRLLSPFAHAAASRASVLAEVTRLEVATGKSETALARLERLHRARQLPVSSLEPLLDLLLGAQKADVAIEVASHYALDGLPSWLLANLADAALAQGRADFAAHMLATLGDRFLQAHPVLGARIALARGDSAGAQRWARDAARRPLLHYERLGLAQVYAALGQRENAIAALLALSGDPETPEGAIVDLANLYLAADDAPAGLTVIARLRASGRRSPAIDARWALLALKAGHLLDVRDYLAGPEARQLPTDALADIYFVATDAGAPSIALTAAERLFARRADRTSRLQLAAALVAVRQPLKALPHLRALLPGTADVESLYVDALRRAWADGAPVRAELVRFWSAKLPPANGPQLPRAEILHALIDLQEFDSVLPALSRLARHDDRWLFAYVEGSSRTGQQPELVKFLQSELDRRDLSWPQRTTRLHLLREHGGDLAALPYLRQFAEMRGDEWLLAYEEALQTLNRRDDLVAFWKATVRRRDVPDAVKRAIAARSLTAGESGLAQSILAVLAADASPESPDVQQLLYAWGPQPTDSQLDWLERRARAASGTARLQWMQHLFNAGAPQRVVAVADGGYSEVYLRALVATGRGEALSRAIGERVARVTSPEELRFLARIALEGSQSGAMRVAFEKLLASAPDDEEALRQLGMLDAIESRLPQARARLGRYVANGGSDYAAHFSFAEILARAGEHARARGHFERTLAEIARYQQVTPHMRTMQALALHRIGRVADAFAAFDVLLAQHPENDHLRADYAGALLQSARYAEAAVVLAATATPASPDSAEAREARLRLRVLSSQLLQAQARSGPAAADLRLLLAEHPTYVPALLSLAQVERERGRWRIADALLTRVLGIDPANDDANRARGDLRTQHGGRVQVQSDWLHISGGQREQRRRISAEELIAGGVRLGTNVEQNDVSVGGRRTVRQRAEVFLQAESERGFELRPSAFLAHGAFGGGLRAGYADGPRRTFVQAELGRAYWDVMDTGSGYTRDRVEVHRDDRRGRMFLGVTGAVNRYHAAGAAGAARSLAVDANVGLLLRRANPALTARYGLDLESVRLRDAGALPLISREVHHASAAVQQRLAGRLLAEVTAGYAWDRLGAAGPFGSGHLTFEGPGRLGLQLWFEQRLHSLVTDQRVTRAGAHVVVRLDRR